MSKSQDNPPPVYTPRTVITLNEVRSGGSNAQLKTTMSNERVFESLQRIEIQLSKLTTAVENLVRVSQSYPVASAPPALNMRSRVFD